MVNAIELQARTTANARASSQILRAPSTVFSEVLANSLHTAKDVRFSAHASQRLADRQIALSKSDKAQIANAVDKAAAKGARETLLLMDKLALVVSVPNRTVITAMSQHELRDTVFTNIDSAVVVAQGGSGKLEN